MRKTDKATVGVMLFLVMAYGTAAGQHKLTLAFTGMALHQGELMQIRVLDKADMEEVGRKTIDTIPSDSFEAELYVLILGRSYWIDFYTDASGNGRYDDPPLDHAWRLEVNDVAGDEILNFSHNPGFTNIGWDPDFNLSDYAGTWTGYWVNLTYGSTAEANAYVEVIPESLKVRVTSTSSLILGNPETQTKTGEGSISADLKSVTVNAPPPWTGSASALHGEISGTGMAPDFGGTHLEIRGNFGRSRMIAAFFISGPFDANGIIVMNKQQTGVGDHRMAGLPDGFELNQNYPNPFNPYTTIAYTLPEQSNVTLDIFNITGERMITLAEGGKSPGTHSVIWDATDERGQAVPAGTYLCRIQAGPVNRTIRMMLLK